MYALRPLRQLRQLQSADAGVCLRCHLRRTIWKLQRNRLPRSVLTANENASAHSTVWKRKLGGVGAGAVQSRRQFQTRQGLRQQYSSQHNDEDGQPTSRTLDQGRQAWEEEDTVGTREGRANEAQDSLQATKDQDDGDLPSYFSEENVLPAMPDPVAVHSQLTAGRQRLRTSRFQHNFDPNRNKRAIEVEALGEPGSILALPHKTAVEAARAVEQAKRKQEISKVLAARETHSVDLSSTLEADGAKISPDEVLDSINMVRDDWLADLDPTAIPTQAQCIQVYQQLMDGFNVEQLQQYVRETARDEADDLDDLQGVYSSEFCKRSKWYPGKSSFEKTSRNRLFAETPPADGWRITVADVKKAFKSKSQVTPTKKASLAESILRKSWKLRSAEEAIKIGELDVALNAEHLILLRTRYDLCRQIETQCDVTFEYANESDVVRIRGRYANCGAAFVALYTPLRMVRSKRLDLYRVISAPSEERLDTAGPERLWQPKLLDQIGAFTKTQITKVTDNSDGLTAFDVMFLAPQQAPTEEIELLIFNRVKRLVEEIVSDQSSYNDVRALVDSPNCYQVPVQGSTALPMYNRSASWYRFRSLKSDASELEPSRDAELEFKLGARVGLSLLETWRRLGARGVYENYERLQKRWSALSEPAIVVRSGQLAFDDPNKEEPLLTSQQKPRQGKSGVSKDESWNARFQAFSHSRRRVFVPSIPGAVSTFEQLNEADVTEEQRIVLILKPSALIAANPRLEDTDASVLPDLRIELAPSTDERGAAVILDARLVGRFPSVQVMMPSEEFDMQLVSSPFVRASVEESRMDGDLRDYIDQVVIHDGNLDERSLRPSLKLVVPELAKRINSLSEYGPRSYRFLTDMLAVKARLSGESKESRSIPSLTAADLSTPLRGEVGSASMSLDYEKQNKDAGDQARETIIDHKDAKQWADDEEFDEEFDEDEEAALLDEDGQKDSYKDRPSEEGLPFDSLLVDFHLSGLEYHSRLHGRFQGFPLTYTIVNAGGAGGQYEELSLHARPSAESQDGLFDSPTPDRVSDLNSDADASFAEEMQALSEAEAELNLDRDDFPATKKLQFEVDADESSSTTSTPSTSPISSQPRPPPTPAGLFAAALAQARERDRNPKAPKAGKDDSGDGDGNDDGDSVKALRGWYRRRRKDNPNIGWFLSFFRAALTMVRGKEGMGMGMGMSMGTGTNSVVAGEIGQKTDEVK